MKYNPRTLLLRIVATAGFAIIGGCTASLETDDDFTLDSTKSPLPIETAVPTTSGAVIVSAGDATPTNFLSPLPTDPADTPTSQDTAVYTYRIINAYPHDPHAYTQGLVSEEGILYESTGQYGQSSLRRVEPETGRITQIHELSLQHFGEGITIYDKSIIQLTWRSRLGFVYDKESFELIGTFSYPTQGWGITHDGSRLIMSDGTSTLYFLDPETFEAIGQLAVHDDGKPVTRLNELEFVRGEVYANILKSDRIARIDPGSGQVTGWIDLEGLLSPEDHNPPVDVLNGIAYDAEQDRLFVTGKYWPKLFEIELVPARD